MWTTYALNPYLRANDLKVVLQNGKAVLTGKVDSGAEQSLAIELAQNARDVNSANAKALTF
ncbi:BON domain-containing protein [Rheinheimera riviphila]|uniref:BON domain-containing protein n=1 Tax=Rheinheimera riviphila TaxID=1834037 RepID=UPI001981B702|nr:BON domain-containing protein [Rheinheimera riviphila]